MDKDFQKQLAKQLRKPEGEMAGKVASAMNESNRQMNEFAIGSLNLKSGQNVLEIGMGNGFFVKQLFIKENDIHYTGFDYSADMIKEAAELNKSIVKNGKAVFVKGDVGNLPFKEKSFDLIFTVNTLYFWEKPEKVLEGLKRIMKDDGELTIVIRTKENMKKFPFTDFGFTLYSEKDLIHLLESNQWKINQSLTKKEDKHWFEGQSISLETLIVTASK